MDETETEDAPGEAIVGDVTVTAAGVVPVENAMPSLVDKPVTTQTPEGVKAEAPPTLQQLNAHAVAHSHRLSTLTSTLHDMTKVIEAKLRELFEAGEDVSAYAVKLVKAPKKTDTPKE